MDNLLTVTFEAHNTARNHHRRYQISVGRDLFGEWTVCINYGRTGQAGRELHFAATEAGVVQRIVRERLRRRLSAPKRIGCPYQITALTAMAGFDTADWLGTSTVGIPDGRHDGQPAGKPSGQKAVRPSSRPTTMLHDDGRSEPHPTCSHRL